MGQRGPKPKDALTVEVREDHRPAPPPALTDEQKFEWLAITNASAAAEFSPKQIPMLEAYCRHRVALRHVGELIKEFENQDELDITAYDKLLKMQERESRALASLAVRLGFAHTTSARGKKPPSGSGAFGKKDNYNF